ncbi:MAG: ribonuclease R [Bacteroidetes bacterium]|nr:MAG: ribonuclease R [Bacteroidota bacterium]
MKKDKKKNEKGQASPTDQQTTPNAKNGNKKQHFNRHKGGKGKKEKNAQLIAEIPQRLADLFESKPSKVFSINDIFSLLRASQENAKMEVVRNLEAMLDVNAIVMNTHGNFKSNSKLPEAEGIVDFVNARFAFVVCEGMEDDIWVSADDLKFAIDGDRVKVRYNARKGGKKIEGEVIEILERNKTEFVGKIDIRDRYAFVTADSRKMHMDIFVHIDNIMGAKSGEKVIVKVHKWHDETNSPTGKVIKVLGKAGAHNTEMHAILAEYGLPTDFPEGVEAEAEKIKWKLTKTELKKRRDFRDITTFTIDPDDAKDFDDALSVRTLENGNWEIGIHIADVTHYIALDSALEKEANRRATSVYLVDRVVPMLPEALSNDLCSLKPDVDRLTFSAVFEMDKNAKILSEWFGRTVIHSNRRFAYEEAQQILEAGKGDYAKELKLLNTLAKKMMKDRFAKGAINFETTEVKFKLDENGTPIGIFVKERKDAHRLIEEFMLLANKKVAEFIFHQKNKEGESPVMVYRIHEKPDVERLQNFATFAQKFGYSIDTGGKALATSINRLVTETAGSTTLSFLQTLAIRAMAKARYSTDAIGHFGLAFQHYTHFTSPIRRYPDMMVHRLVQHYLDKKGSVDKAEYDAFCKHSTNMEKRAMDAERASIKYKQVEYMSMMESKVFEGTISGVTEFGMYVEITETKCEGMVRLADMFDDQYELDSANYCIRGRKRGNVLSFGDTVKVKVKSTDLERRTMDLILVRKDI